MSEAEAPMKPEVPATPQKGPESAGLNADSEAGRKKLAAEKGMPENTSWTKINEADSEAARKSQ